MEHRGRFGAAVGELRGVQKPSEGASLHSRYVDRPAGRVLAAAAHLAGLSPNQVTLISAGFSFAGIAALALLPPSWPLGLCVYAALVLGRALDSADGQLARLHEESSPAGEWLDRVVDCAVILAVHSAVLVSFHRFFELPAAVGLLLPLAFQFTAVLVFFGGLLASRLLPDGAGPRHGSVALLPVDRGVFCAVFLLLGSEEVFVAGYALFFVAHAVFLAVFFLDRFRELSGPTS